MFYKKIEGFSFDVAKAAEAYKQLADQMLNQSDRYLGIGLLGANKDDTAGAVLGGASYINSQTKEYKLDSDYYKKLILKTKACIPPFDDMILNLRNWFPYRARLSLMPPKTVLEKHVDSVKECWRVNGAIITNKDCHFVWYPKDGPEVRLHMPADGSAYFVRTDITHSFINDGDTDRLHFVCGLKLRVPAEVAT